MPGPCCPLACGVACCGTSDVLCLDPSQGLCCGADHPQGCGGRVCCLATDSCFPGTGTCCPQGQVACPPQGTCCPTNSVCDVTTGNCCPLGSTTCGQCGHLGQKCCDNHTCTANAAAGTPNAPPPIGCDTNPSSNTFNKCVLCGAASTTTRTIIHQVLHADAVCQGTDTWFTCQSASPWHDSPACFAGNLSQGSNPWPCDPGFRQGQCTSFASTGDPNNPQSSGSPTSFNGSKCTATWWGSSCSCIVRVQTPNDCSKWVDCITDVTETKAPLGCP